MPFSLTNQKAKLASLNTRAEVSGPDKVPAADLRFSINVPSDALAGFAPTLRGHLYCKNGDGGDLANQSHDAPNLRYPRLGALPWSGDIMGATLTVHHGLGGKSDLVLADAKVNRFVIEPQEGGTCIVKFRVQAHPGDREVGRLYNMIQREVDISLEGPDWSDDEDDEDEGDE
jgi:hypothetical protein